MKKYYFIIFFFFLANESSASIKNNIIQKLNFIENISFNFEQNINDKIEKGKCVLKYPKKIFCEYDELKNKILVANGKSLVIKTENGSYYRYAIKSTPLNYLLDKNFLIKEIKKLNERVIDNKFVNFTIFRDENEINIFFDIKNFNLIGWQTLDIYQNLNITYISSLKKNKILRKNIFNLPEIN